MQAPYLIIEGKPVEIGQKYWTVQIDGDHTLLEHIAARENNTIDKCYFLDKKKAKHYQWMKGWVDLLLPQIAEWEKEHRLF
jgi:hypothetical protein